MVKEKFTQLRRERVRRYRLENQKRDVSLVIGKG